VPGYTSLFFDVFDGKRQAFVEICLEKHSDPSLFDNRANGGKIGDWERHIQSGSFIGSFHNFSNSVRFPSKDPSSGINVTDNRILDV
jgi:hypothetical protein